ncbi:efflux transporter periplasmic adaptor subunit [Bacterioplanes sanyensis]|uniref:Efflux transporter periplasmic adaptor subunit n=1 Tax=Bacterioplanes sanyensis TaxID=1249553 RepID=A0A222FNG2_9GAMM|nr:efflux RND transporter periplasmic adaptor subunit [Bacterioplanes sanyensis]ASP40222.1 efflux transporter periplasmic adaptor subunit [Bacterioplanes sanyensis]
MNLWCTALLLLLPLFGQSVMAQPAVVVQVQTTQQRAFSQPVFVSGLLENQSEQTLAFKVAGLVQSVPVDEGSRVKQGQVLAALDLEEIDARVAKAESVLANAERQLTRFQSLQGSNALSIERLQQAETEVQVARSDLTVARFNQRHAVIRAPADGRVLKRFVEPNELAAVGTPMFAFAADTDGWVLSAGVTDRDVVRLRLGDEAQLSFDAFPGQTFAAEVSEMAGRADASHTFRLALRIEQADANMLAGLVGHAQITPSRQYQATPLPLTAMVRGHHGEVEVFIARNQTAVLQRLPLLALQDDTLWVANLASDTEVIVRGAQYLTDGAAIRIQE